MDDLPNKLAMVEMNSSRAAARWCFIKAQIELLAEVEHGRFNAEHWLVGDLVIGTFAGYTPYLKPWKDLTRSIQEYDREAVQKHRLCVGGSGVGRHRRLTVPPEEQNHADAKIFNVGGGRGVSR